MTGAENMITCNNLGYGTPRTSAPGMAAIVGTSMGANGGNSVHGGEPVARADAGLCVVDGGGDAR